MKNIIKWVLFCLALFISKKGLKKSIAAPVVPISEANTLHMPKNIILAIVEGEELSLMWIPWLNVYKVNNVIMNGM